MNRWSLSKRRAAAQARALLEGPLAPTVCRTPRLWLRAWAPTDAPFLRAVLDHSDAHLRPWIPFMSGEPRSLVGTRDELDRWRAAFDSGRAFRYGAWLPRSEVLVGELMLIRRDEGGERRYELGYWLHRDFCGQGLAVEGGLHC